ncbi:tetratricopeptide repeat protein [Flavobacterium sp. HXWNR70]|uniref:Tetratricopeptide repeat protein n=2 Tax=Flavobacterium luminosum TaxID=2949086 RepID=A0ABT0TLB0_9FLAO|nr:tetratricopeptide repeat protein [Flavobacterium sp. HXWNR70]MCL9808283.1 tetratricopeptide repeat protein [Flavobacterium sp. HXWNR70]
MKSIFKIVFLLTFVAVSAQQKKDFALPDGNDEFQKKQYAEAEANYRVSKSINEKRATASYNLGNAIYRQNQPSEAKFAYAKAIEMAKGKQQKHRAYHNLGNVFMKEKAYDRAVEAYKNALRNNPADEETRYNYALAKKMLKENPPKGNDKKDNKQDNKDNNKDQNKDQNKQNQDNKDQNNKDQNQNKEKPEDQKENQNNQEPKPGNVPKDRLQNLLDAVNNEEKKIQDRVNAKKVKGKPVEEGKDW